MMAQRPGSGTSSSKLLESARKQRAAAIALGDREALSMHTEGLVRATLSCAHIPQNVDRGVKKEI